ncbi:MAG TPA: PHP domain-containing protein [Pirellulales bacterium]|nr:PHP domain-containing protein [Pirellulales bacterium]
MRIFGGLLVPLLCLLPVSRVSADALERMRMERLRATHARVLALQNERVPVDLKSAYDDVRALLHVHSAFSHDSRGTIEEILAAAKATGVRVIMFTEHPADHYDYFKDGHQGVKDGVLLIPGAETGGFLAYPTRSLKEEKTGTPQEFANLVRRDDGLIFLCHLEERMDWNITGLTGTEIYNTHADFMEETKFISSLKTPIGLLALIPAVKQFPQETFAALQDYPAGYLKKFDEMCQQTRHVGVSANDAHHNQAFRGRVTDDGKMQLDDALGKKLLTLDPDKVPLIKPMVSGKQPGDLVFELDLDPYERSFRHVSTHLLMKQLTHDSVWDALKGGRAYVAFDWMGDPTGFVFQADRDNETWTIGGEVPGPNDLRLRAAAPLAGKLKLIRNGEVVAEQDGSTLEHAVSEAGVYRVEVWLNLAGEPRPWILTSPIYVREASK